MKKGIIFDFPFTIKFFNSRLDFYGKEICKRLEIFLSKEVSSQKTLIDIGAGTRKYQQIVEKFEVTYFSLDLSKSHNAEIHDFLSNDLEIPLADAAMDLAIHIQVLEHMRDPLSSLLEAKRILKSDGRLFLSTNFLYPIHGEPHDYLRFSRYGLEELIFAAGLEIESIEEIGGGLKAFAGSLLFQRDQLLQARILFPQKTFSKILILPIRILLNSLISGFVAVFILLDSLIYLPKFTSGYTVECSKRQKS